MENGPQNHPEAEGHPAVLRRIWLGTSIGCSGVGAFAIYKAIELAEHVSPAEDPGVIMAPTAGLIFTGLAIAAFDRYLHS